MSTQNNYYSWEMMSEMNFRKTGFWYLIILAFLLNFAVQLTHEAGHWIVYSLAGNAPVWGFTRLTQTDAQPLNPAQWVESVSPDGSSNWLKFSTKPNALLDSVALAAGPAASVLGVIAGLLLVRFAKDNRLKQIGMVTALNTSFTMGMYYLRGFSRLGGDEYFLAAHLGIPKFMIDIPFCVLFIIAFVVCIKSFERIQTWLRWFGIIILGSAPSVAFMMQADNLILSQIDKGNPLFRPILGFSMPVLATYGFILIGFIFWYRADRALSLHSPV